MWLFGESNQLLSLFILGVYNMGWVKLWVYSFSISQAVQHLFQFLLFFFFLLNSCRNFNEKSNRQLKRSCECNEEWILIYQSCSPMWLNLNLCERSKGGGKVILGFSVLYIHSMSLNHIFLSLSSYFCHINSDVTHFNHFWRLALHNEWMWGRSVRWRKLE